MKKDLLDAPNSLDLLDSEVQVFYACAQATQNIGDNFKKSRRNKVAVMRPLKIRPARFMSLSFPR